MNPTKIRVTLYALLITACLSLSAQHATAQEDAPAQEGDSKPMVRLVFASGLGEAQKVVLASKRENGGWNPIAETDLQEPMISDWLPSSHGDVHVLFKKNGKPESIGHFTQPADCRRLLVILTADEDADGHRVNTVDPDKDGFKAGSTVIVNLSKIRGFVTLGAEPLSVEAGRHLVAKPAAKPDGGYRLMVEYSGEEDAKQLCYDRYMIINPNTRNFILLLPDPDTALRVMSISEFGPFE